MMATISIPGRCQICGCTNATPCVLQDEAGAPLRYCAWLTTEETLCTNFRCIAQVPIGELEAMILAQIQVAR